MKTGLHAKKHFLLREDEAEFELLWNDVLARKQPVGALETRIVHQLVRIYWQLELIDRAEDARHARLTARAAGGRTCEFELTGAIIGGKLHMFEGEERKMILEAGRSIPLPGKTLTKR